MSVLISSTVRSGIARSGRLALAARSFAVATDGQRTAVAARTDDWVEAVTGLPRDENARPKNVDNIFAEDGVLLGTVSRTIRTKDGAGVLNIEDYFEYFAKLPDNQVVRREDNIVSVTDDVFVNNAMVYWSWSGDGAPTPDEPLCARMTFIFFPTATT